MWGFREDDSNWPKKNIVGKQELEIKIGGDHINFEVRLFTEPSSLEGMDNRMNGCLILKYFLDCQDWFTRRYPG